MKTTALRIAGALENEKAMLPIPRACTRVLYGTCITQVL
jgi:hypothetical protein